MAYCICVGALVGASVETDYIQTDRVARPLCDSRTSSEPCCLAHVTVYFQCLLGTVFEQIWWWWWCFCEDIVFVNMRIRMDDDIPLLHTNSQKSGCWLAGQYYRRLPRPKRTCTRSPTVAETARRFVSLNILLSHQGHSRSLEMTLLRRACVSPY